MPHVGLTVLGSGGVIPTNERLTSSFLIYDWRGYTILLDAGEGVQINLHKAPKSVHDIDLILITHEHGDHINGLAGLLQSMAVTRRESPLTIGGPPSVIEFSKETLEATSKRLGFEINYLVLENEGSLTVNKAGGDKLIVTWAPACHTQGSLAYRLEWILRPRINMEKLKEIGVRPGPWLTELFEKRTVIIDDKIVSLDSISTPGKVVSITYTGDTAPCASIIDLAKGSTLLIHDSTYSSELEGEAIARGHSTAEHAALVAQEATVENLLLFHVSPRYRGYEAWKLYREARRVFPKTMLAWDLMNIRISF